MDIGLLGVLPIQSDGRKRAPEMLRHLPSARMRTVPVLLHGLDAALIYNSLRACRGVRPIDKGLLGELSHVPLQLMASIRYLMFLCGKILLGVVSEVC